LFISALATAAKEEDEGSSGGGDNGDANHLVAVAVVDAAALLALLLFAAAAAEGEEFTARLTVVPAVDGEDLETPPPPALGRELPVFPAAAVGALGEEILLPAFLLLVSPPALPDAAVAVAGVDELGDITLCEEESASLPGKPISLWLRASWLNRQILRTVMRVLNSHVFFDNSSFLIVVLLGSAAAGQRGGGAGRSIASRRRGAGLFGCCSGRRSSLPCLALFLLLLSHLRVGNLRRGRKPCIFIHVRRFNCLFLLTFAFPPSFDSIKGWLLVMLTQGGPDEEGCFGESFTSPLTRTPLPLPDPPDDGVALSDDPAPEDGSLFDLKINKM
jgi:hypothetical protein